MKTKKIFLNKKTADLKRLEFLSKKEKVRKEFFKLKKEGLSCAACKERLKELYIYKVSIRTLQRWNKRFKEANWNLKDASKRPKTIHYKVTPKIRKKIAFIGNKTGWKEYRIAKLFPDISHVTIGKILKEQNLLKGKISKRKILKQK